MELRMDFCIVLLKYNLHVYVDLHRCTINLYLNIFARCIMLDVDEWDIQTQYQQFRLSPTHMDSYP